MQSTLPTSINEELAAANPGAPNNIVSPVIFFMRVFSILGGAEQSCQWKASSSFRDKCHPGDNLTPQTFRGDGPFNGKTEIRRKRLRCGRIARRLHRRVANKRCARLSILPVSPSQLKRAKRLHFQYFGNSKPDSTSDILASTAA
jgi:hypothetical protein